MVVEVFAGFVVGYALSLIVSPAAAIALVRSNDRSGFAQRVAPPGTNVVALSVVVHFSAMLMLTAVGMMLGLLLGVLNERQPAGGFGSPNLAYTLLVVSLTAALVIPTLVIPALRKFMLGGAFVFTVAFGWAMPWLAEAR